MYHFIFQAYQKIVTMQINISFASDFHIIIAQTNHICLHLSKCKSIPHILGKFMLFPSLFGGLFIYSSLLFVLYYGCMACYSWSWLFCASLSATYSVGVGKAGMYHRLFHLYDFVLLIKLALFPSAFLLFSPQVSINGKKLANQWEI